MSKQSGESRRPRREEELVDIDDDEETTRRKVEFSLSRKKGRRELAMTFSSQTSHRPRGNAWP